MKQGYVYHMLQMRSMPIINLSYLGQRVVFTAKRALYLQNNSNPSKIVILTFANPNQFSINFVVQDLNAVDLTMVIIVNNSTKIV